MKGTILKIGEAERMPDGDIRLRGWILEGNGEFTSEELLEISQKYEPNDAPLTFRVTPADGINGLTCDGIRIEGNATKIVFRNNFFRNP